MKSKTHPVLIFLSFVAFGFCAIVLCISNDIVTELWSGIGTIVFLGTTLYATMPSN